MPTLKDDAIVLRLMDWSETSQITVLLSREHGKVSATAKGAKRNTPSVMARFSGGLESVTRGQAVWIAKPGRDLANLIEWDLVDGYWGVRRDLNAFALAMYAVDLVHHMLHDDDPHSQTFDALAGYLRTLGDASGDTSGGSGGAALLRFQWVVVEDAGYRPALEPRPRNRGGPVMHFSPRAGGLVEAGGADTWRVRRKTVEVLHAVANNQDVAAHDAQAVAGANRLLCAYCRAILDKHLPTMDAVLGNRPR